jgi:hypothetical protein
MHQFIDQPVHCKVGPINSIYTSLYIVG